MVDQTALGYLLIEMGLITEKQLEEVVKLQGQIHQDARLGRLLVRRGICDEDEVKQALSYQHRLRKTDPTHRAIIMADLAMRRKRRASVVAQRERVMQKGARVFRSISDEYPEVGFAEGEDTIVEQHPVREYPVVKGTHDNSGEGK